jgi:site-specific DNA recombinase
MKRAILYTRVSTDEQANSGYSLGVQHAQLVKYCEMKGIEIDKHFVDDHSAKSFDRPQFKQLLAYAKARQKHIDYLFCVSWDRFSRNTSDAYEMLSQFEKMNIEVQAIMQPIDFSIPQNKVMLAIYLVLPEVDNDLRAINIKKGIHGARKEGRWTSNAPRGYRMVRDDCNKPLLVPHPVHSYAVQWAFEEVAKGLLSPNEIRMQMIKLDSYVSKSNFYTLLRNPVYVGKIVVPAFNGEPKDIIDGIHEAIVSDETFIRVQNILEEKSKRLNRKITTFRDRNELPLRGLLTCSNCGKHVTGSASKSRNGSRHFYYHCLHCKQERFRAETVNSEMEELLSAIHIIEEVDTLYAALIEKELKQSNKATEQDTAKLQEDIKRFEERKDKLKEDFINEKLSASDYSELKGDLEARITALQLKIQESKDQKNGVKEQVNKALKFIPNLLERYRNSSVQEKKEIIGSIFPEKFTFQNNEVRTTFINHTIALILNSSKGFTKRKSGQKKYFTFLSALVENIGLEPITSTLPALRSSQMS